MFTIGLLHIIECNDTLTAALRLGKLKVNCFSDTLRWGNALHFLQLLESSLRLCRLAGFGAEAAHEIFKMGDFALLIIVGC